MLLKDEVGMLRQVPLFSGVAPAKLKLLAFTSDRVTYAPGQLLFRQGDVGDAAYVVLSGKAEVMVDSPAGQIKVAEVDPNSIVGEIAILCKRRYEFGEGWCVALDDFPATREAVALAHERVDEVRLDARSRLEIADRSWRAEIAKGDRPVIDHDEGCFG